MTKKIAVDGPSGAGKSTLSRMLAQKHGLIYVDTGAMYRSVGLYMIRNHINPACSDSVVSSLPEISIAMDYDKNGVQRMYLNGEDVSSEIRLPEVSLGASTVSAIPDVRRFLLNMQQDLACRHSVIMDGRDIGTVVLPDAGLKIYLSASAEARAKRRFEELSIKGVNTSFEEVLNDMKIRDYNDSTRAAAPLRPAQGAVIVDTTDMNLIESFDYLSELVEAYLKKE